MWTYSFERDGQVLGGDLLMATDKCTGRSQLVNTHSVIHTLLDVNIYDGCDVWVCAGEGVDVWVCAGEGVDVWV